MSKTLMDEYDLGNHQEEVFKRWGATQEFKESHTRTSGYSASDFHAARLESDQAIQMMIRVMLGGEPADSDAAIAAARAHQDAISHWYYECSDEIHLSLADMYVADARFTQYFESRQRGLSQFLHDAIAAKSPGLRI